MPYRSVPVKVSTGGDAAAAGAGDVDAFGADVLGGLDCSARES